MYSINIINTAINGVLHGKKRDDIIKYLSFDSRKISFPEKTLFFAFEGSSRNGHLYIQDVYEQGVRCFCISQPISYSKFPECVFLLVENTLAALQQLATFHRIQFTLPVIGITGSNGKTIVKEWLNQLLENNYIVVRSPKSYNSQIGVPLSVWQINKSHNLGIFEAGISRPAEMQIIEQIIQPQIVLITNIGAAHSEGFASQKQKIKEKLLLAKNAKCLIYCTNHIAIGIEAKKLVIEKFTWGSLPQNNLIVHIIERTATGAVAKITNREKKETNIVNIPFTNDAAIENCLHCIAICTYLEMQMPWLAQQLPLLPTIEMRLEWKKAINNSFLLNDSYSNDISSFIIALNYLQQQNNTAKQTLILSDFFESGLDVCELYATVAELVHKQNITRLILVGQQISQHHHLFEKNTLAVFSFTTTAALIDEFDSLPFNNESILLKGARSFGFERIAVLLEQQLHQTVLEINLSAITHNLNYYKSLLQPQTKIMVMVKAFGYGSGDAEIARLLQFHKVDYLAVAYTDEGVALRKAGIHLPIMVMNPETTGFETLENYNLEPEIYSFQLLEQFAAYCKAQGIAEYPIHIKIDTGMHRLGFNNSEIPALADFLATQNVLIVKSAFTHLAATEAPAHDKFTHLQAEKFINACRLIEEKTITPFIKHAVNTAGIRRHSAFHFDMVRLGIGLYGMEEKNNDIQVVSTLKTTVAQLRVVKAGETVGYNRMGRLEKDAIIATVRIGYADGYARQLGNGNGSMYIKGQPAPVIGNVCMDMTMLNVSHISNVTVADEVEVFGENMSVQELAERCGTISYEILTGISQRVKRVYVQE